MGLRNRAEPRCGRMDCPFCLMEPRPITYLENHVWVLHALLLVLISHSSYYFHLILLLLLLYIVLALWICWDWL